MTLHPSPQLVSIDHQDASDHADNAAEFRVTAIGSCRVLSPLRRIGPHAGFTLDQAGVFGYVHSSTEALQQLRLMLDGTPIPEDLEPLVAPGLADNPALRSKHDPAHFYFIELSSAKLITIDGFAVQLNYFTRHFGDFFADRAVSRQFWRLAQANDVKCMKDFLDGLEAYAALDADRRALLPRVRLTYATQPMLETDINAILDTVPRALFVTHFNATRSDLIPLKARAEYIALCRTALSAVGARYFDPSDYVEAFGQEDALDDPSSSLSHYAPEFEDYLSQHWLTRYIWPEIDARNRAISRRTQKPQPVAKAALKVAQG